MSSALDLMRDADDLLRLATLTQSENVKRILAAEATKLVQLAEAEEKLKQEPKPKPLRPTFTTTKIYNYGWDQSDKFLKIYVTLNGVHTFGDNCYSSSFQDKSIDLQVVDETKKVNHVLNIKNLLYPIVPSGSYVKVKTDMIVLFLKKASSKDWTHVTEAEKKAKEPKSTPKLDKDDDPNAGLMTLMKQMYEDGDDDMKRTIAKAWTEARDKKNPDDVM